MKNVLNGGRENIKSLCSTNFQLLSVSKNTGRKKLYIYIKKLIIKLKVVCFFFFLV
jgi:hypothetical protein